MVKEYDKYGFNKDGFNKYGFNCNGYDCNGYDRDGYDEDGFDKNGFNAGGLDKNGYDKDGFNKYGFNCNGYDARGHDRAGLDKDGLDKDGLDAGCDGYDENRTANMKQYSVNVPISMVVTCLVYADSARAASSLAREQVNKTIIDDAESLIATCNSLTVYHSVRGDDLGTSTTNYICAEENIF